MVLEETLILRGPIDIPDIARAFREVDMPARITQTINLESLTSIRGTIGAIRTLFTEEIAKLEGLAGETDTEDDEDIGLRDSYVHYLGVVERVSEAATEFMERHQPGDVITDSEIKDWMTPPTVSPVERDSGAALSSDSVVTALDKFILLNALGDNDIIDVDDEFVTLREHVAPENIVLILPADAAGNVSPNVLHEYGIMLEVVITTMPEHRLEFGPEVVFSASLSEIDALAADLELDEDEYLSFREALSLKQVVASRTMEVFEDGVVLTQAEVAEILEDSALADDDENWSITLNLSPEFINEVLKDLRKIGLLRKKGSGFRAV